MNVKKIRYLKRKMIHSGPAEDQTLRGRTEKIRPQVLFLRDIKPHAPPEVLRNSRFGDFDQPFLPLRGGSFGLGGGGGESGRFEKKSPAKPLLSQKNS